jgi:hypothetical protein
MEGAVRSGSAAAHEVLSALSASGRATVAAGSGLDNDTAQLAATPT